LAAFGSTTRSPLLLNLFKSTSTFGYKTVVRREKNTIWIEEQIKYKAEMKELRKKHLKEYWERQTQVENAYLDKFREDRMAKQKRDLDRWRTAICNISMHTKK
jgi:hypothetical protein